MVIYPKGFGERKKVKWQRRKVRFGIIGCGYGSFINNHHLAAAWSLPICSLVAAAPSRKPELCHAFRRATFMPKERVYTDWKKMLETESRRGNGPQGRPDAVIICTETEFHAEMIVEALEKGFHVICDKPMTVTLAEALLVQEAARKTGLTVTVTFNHNCYPAVIEARRLVASGALGKLHTGRAWFLQDWGVGNPNFKQTWRFNRERFCVTDISTHAERLAAFVSGQRLEQIRAWSSIIQPGRVGDDHNAARLTYNGGLNVMLEATEMQLGHSDDLGIELHGEQGSVLWRHGDADALAVFMGGKQQRFISGRDFSNPAKRNPPEHPHGFNDGWHATFRGAIGRILVATGEFSAEELPDPLNVAVADVNEGVESAAFVEAFCFSAENHGEATSVEFVKTLSQVKTVQAAQASTEKAAGTSTGTGQPVVAEKPVQAGAQA